MAKQVGGRKQILDNGWEELPDLPSAMGWPGVAYCPGYDSSKIWIFGGENNGDCYVFDIEAMDYSTFTTYPNQTIPHWHTVISDTQRYVLSSGGKTKHEYMFDLVTKQWIDCNNNAIDAGIGAKLIWSPPPNNDVYLVGGVKCKTSVFHRKMEPKSQQWTSIKQNADTTLRFSDHDSVVTVSTNEMPRITVFGGEHADNKICELDQSIKKWSVNDECLPVKIGNMKSIACVNDEAVLIFGGFFGYQSKRQISDAIYLYSTEQRRILQTLDVTLPMDICAMGVVVTTDDYVHIVGGYCTQPDLQQSTKHYRIHLSNLVANRRYLAHIAMDCIIERWVRKSGVRDGGDDLVQLMVRFVGGYYHIPSNDTLK